MAYKGKQNFKAKKIIFQEKDKIFGEREKKRPLVQTALQTSLQNPYDSATTPGFNPRNLNKCNSPLTPSASASHRPRCMRKLAGKLHPISEQLPTELQSPLKHLLKNTLGTGLHNCLRLDSCRFEDPRLPT